MNAREFERWIYRIEEMLADDIASVEWDAHIPDPDNPSQLRQVDILIEREGLRTLVECRHHAVPQDVTWIEELYGRRASLRADAAIAVSSSGFSEGALRKADALGIGAREFRELTESEILDWGRGTRVFAKYLQLGRFVLYVVFASTAIVPAKIDLAMLRTPDGKPWDMERLVHFVVDTIKNAEQSNAALRIQIFVDNLVVNGLSVGEVFVEVEVRHLTVPLLLPTVRTYGPPRSVSESVQVETVPRSEFELLHAEDGLRLTVDFSIVQIPPRSFFVGFVFDLGQPLPMSEIALVGQPQSDWSFFPFEINGVRLNSGAHAALRSTTPGSLIHPL
jgi:hypothetical protein